MKLREHAHAFGKLLVLVPESSEEHEKFHAFMARTRTDRRVVGDKVDGQSVYLVRIAHDIYLQVPAPFQSPLPQGVQP